jgi:3-methyladenine DNA glycosylase AlkC
MTIDGTRGLRGARSYAQVDSEFRTLLETGTVESRTHIEQMSLDMGQLLISTFPSLAEQADRVRRPSFLCRMRSAAEVLLEAFGNDAISLASQSASDTVRGWGAFVVGHAPGLALPDRLKLIRPLAADAHFAVREWAWLSIRPTVATCTHDAIEQLYPWVMDAAKDIRRFAVEVTRPRGVWCCHIKLLKDEPWLGQKLLNAVAFDSSRYVQNSVGNWLNDASKSQPSWVESICTSWERLDYPATAYVRRRALRSITKTQLSGSYQANSQEVESWIVDS